MRNVKLDENSFNTAKLRAHRMHKLLFDDSGSDDLIEHYLAVALLSTIMLDKMTTSFPKEWTGLCASINEWGSSMLRGVRWMDYTPPGTAPEGTAPEGTVGKIGRCGVPSCPNASTGALCKEHSGR